jgi:hypothetical protein
MFCPGTKENPRDVVKDFDPRPTDTDDTDWSTVKIGLPGLHPTAIFQEDIVPDPFDATEFITSALVNELNDVTVPLIHGEDETHPGASIAAGFSAIEIKSDGSGAA